jgi:hypothetical protein
LAAIAAAAEEAQAAQIEEQRAGASAAE